METSDTKTSVERWIENQKNISIVADSTSYFCQRHKNHILHFENYKVVPEGLVCQAFKLLPPNTLNLSKDGWVSKNQMERQPVIVFLVKSCFTSSNYKIAMDNILKSIDEKVSWQIDCWRISEEKDNRPMVLSIAPPLVDYLLPGDEHSDRIGRINHFNEKKRSKPPKKPTL
jgi:hypothetical protein